MARLAWVTMTRGREAGFNRPPIEPRVDAGVKELTEMTYRSNRRSGEPVATSGARSRSTVRDRTANPIWAGGYGAALQAGHMTAIEPPVKISSRLLNPRGRPHMVADTPQLRRSRGFALYRALSARTGSSRLQPSSVTADSHWLNVSCACQGPKPR